jgi:methyl coenzyme M reductase alpha subunit
LGFGLFWVPSRARFYLLAGAKQKKKKKKKQKYGQRKEGKRGTTHGITSLPL